MFVWHIYMYFSLSVMSHHKKQPVTLLDITDSCIAMLMRFSHLRNMIACIGGRGGLVFLIVTCIDLRPRESQKG